MGDKIKTVGLLTLLTAILLGLGQYYGGAQGLTLMLVLSLAMNVGSYWFSDKIILKTYRAQEVNRETAPELYGIVESLAQRAGLPMPKVFVVPHGGPNAFATGRNPQHAAVAVTQGLLQIMNREELEGVLAHEMAHVQHRDTLTMTIVASLAGVVMWIAWMAKWALIFGGGGRGGNDRGGGLELLVMAIVAPIAAMLVQFAISRTREYAADAGGAKIAGHPVGLAHALEKLGRVDPRRQVPAGGATAHLFIANPLAGQGLMKLFSTHPPIEERIRRLMSPAG